MNMQNENCLESFGIQSDVYHYLLGTYYYYIPMSHLKSISQCGCVFVCVHSVGMCIHVCVYCVSDTSVSLILGGVFLLVG